MYFSASLQTGLVGDGGGPVVHRTFIVAHILVSSVSTSSRIQPTSSGALRALEAKNLEAAREEEGRRAAEEQAGAGIRAFSKLGQLQNREIERGDTVPFLFRQDFGISV